MSARRVGLSAPRAMDPFVPREGEPHIYSVGELISELGELLSGEFPAVVVQGEITDFRRSPGGHIYFRLKDAKAQLQVVFFASKVSRSRVELQNGIHVQVEGPISVYAARGDMQLTAERIQPVGLGALQAQFEALKKKLHAEGLFAEERKRELPAYPTRIAIVTSFTGAAIQDMIRILRQRAAYARITVAPVRVQGVGAAQEIAAAIALVNEWGEADVLIVGRGGGSLEDLWAFNEEIVVRAIVASRIPVVSAVGHEVDFTLADLAADVRAATPTHAAQQVVAHKDETCRRLLDMTKHARDRLLREIQRDRRHLQGFMSHHALRKPHGMVSDGIQSLDHMRERLVGALENWAVHRRRGLQGADATLRAHAPARIVERMRERLLGLSHRAAGSAWGAVARCRAEVAGGERLLESYDYRGVLRRGYALVWSEGGERLINRAAELRPGTPVHVQFQDGRADAQVTRVEPASSGEEETR